MFRGVWTWGCIWCIWGICGIWVVGKHLSLLVCRMFVGLLVCRMFVGLLVCRMFVGLLVCRMFVGCLLVCRMFVGFGRLPLDEECNPLYIWFVGKHLSQQRCVFQPFVAFVVEVVCRKVSSPV